MAAHKSPPQSLTSSSLPIHNVPLTSQGVSSFPRSSQIHTVCDNVGYVSPRYSCPDLPPAPSSPGKLAQKYMDHLNPTQSSHRKLFPKEYISALSQDSVGLQSSKATALVAPYVGDKPLAPNLNQDGDSESPLISIKPKLVCMSHVNPGDGHPGNKWKSLVETKDHLLSQKNILIERQKSTIAHLQAQLREYEEKTWTSSLREGSGPLQAKVKELELKNSALQSELTALQSGKRREVEKLSSKLDSKEYELHKKTTEFSQRQKELVAENSALKSQAVQLEGLVRELESKLEVTDHKNKELSEHVVKLNGYFENMPTMEEHQALKEHCDHADKLTKSLTGQLSERDRDLLAAREKLQDKESACTKLEETCTELRGQLEAARTEATGEAVVKLEAEKAQAVKECHRLQKLLFEADKRCQKELEAMRKRHKDRFLEATADLRARHKTVAKRVKVLEAQLLRNSDAVLAVNEELQLNQGTVNELKSSVRELLVQNQQLVEKNISLQEANEAWENQNSARTQQLAVELTQCLRDFKSLVNVSASLLEGKYSASLLTDRDESEDLNENGLASETDLAIADSHESQLEQIKKLKQEVNSLREFVSDQLALQVSSACHVQ